MRTILIGLALMTIARQAAAVEPGTYAESIINDPIGTGCATPFRNAAEQFTLLRCAPLARIAHGEIVLLPS